MIVDIFLLVIGFTILIKGADLFVDGASGIATKLKIPKIFIGLTIVAFGTSLPELAVSVKSIISGNHDIVLGNVIGSNILNILLILGLSAIFRSIEIKENTIKKEIPLMILLMILLSILLMDSLFDNNAINNLSRSDGFIILIFFSIFIYYLIMVALKKDRKNDIIETISFPKSIIYVVLGGIMIFAGSNLAVDNSADLAKLIGVSEKTIGLTIVALGTSLPELVTGITAAKKGESEMAIGNVVGSNIFNIGIVLGLPVSILGGINRINFNYIDLLLMIFSGILLWFFAFTKRKIGKKEGIIFIFIFIIYYIYILINQ